MKNKYAITCLQLICITSLIIFVSSCKKDNPTPAVVTATPTTLGLYEYSSTTDKRIFIPVTKVGTQSISYLEVFDTGSTGFTIDASGLIPASMITSTGIQVPQDSVVVNGITITNKTGVIRYGSAISPTSEYGNLAYASVTIGDQNGFLTIKRVAFFLYYKATDGNGVALPAHSLDVFGVGPGVSYASASIASPITYYPAGIGLTNGFKLAVLSSQYFLNSPTYVAGLLTIGLTPADLSSSGFIMHPLTFYTPGGYSPDIPATITYPGGSTSATVLFDTGTPEITIIEDKSAHSIGDLPDKSKVTVTTNKGFTYTYTVTGSENLTEVENPNNTGDIRSIFSIEFFIQNEFLTDYTHNQIGLKNN